MTSKLELKLPKWICSYLRLFESSFSQQCDWKTKNAYVFQFSDIYLIPLLVFMFSSADTDILYQGQQASLMKRLLMNLFQGQFVPLHYVSLLCIILDEKCTPTYVNRRYLVLFFSASKKNFHRHVIGFGDIPFISIVCNRAKSSKRLFHTISNLGNAALNLRRWELPAWLQT